MAFQSSRLQNKTKSLLISLQWNRTNLSETIAARNLPISPFEIDEINEIETRNKPKLEIHRKYNEKISIEFYKSL